MKCPVTMIQRVKYSRQVQDDVQHIFVSLLHVGVFLFVPHHVLMMIVT